MEILNWIGEWFKSECNGDWEHENQIIIQTVSNPGWDITIDLMNTSLESLSVENDVIQKSEDDWYFYKIQNGKFIAGGDLGKLSFLLIKFQEIVHLQEELKVD